MKKNPRFKSGLSNRRTTLAFGLCSIGILLALFSFGQTKSALPARQAGLRLALLTPNFTRQPAVAPSKPVSRSATGPARSDSASPLTPTFGHPIISGVGGYGFEEGIRLDPTDPNTVYTSAPDSLSSDTSWIWHSRDGGKTFKWITSAIPFQGKATACAGGGDSELAVDSAGHLYFADLSLVNFGVGRSDDKGATFPCSNSGVPDAVVDRQWYATDGDPTNGGSIYLVNDEIGPGGAQCPNSMAPNNVLVMYRSPANGVGSTAGLLFGPANKITPNLSCDEGIMGNDEVSPVATTTGQPNGMGGFAVLPTPVKHIFVIHDDGNLHQIRLGRCFPVAFGAPIANVSDPSGLNCTDILVAELGATGVRTGGDFPTLAIDKAGNLYAVWEQAPIDATGNVTGDTVLMYSYSTDEGNTWASPIEIDTSGSADGLLHNNVFAWVAAGDDGRVDIAWYGTPELSNTNDSTCGQNATNPPLPGMGKNVNGPDAATGATWSLWFVQTLNGHDAAPTFTAPIQASEHFNHRGTIQTLVGGQCGNRTLGDFLQLRIGSLGEAQISYADSNSINQALTPHAMYAHQNGGTGVFAASSPVNIPGLTPFNSVTDPTGDGLYEVSGTTSANMPQLDITGSSVSVLTSSPCSATAPCYQVTMQLNNLSLAPTTTSDPDIDLVWLTQWLVPSNTDANGGKNFFVYAESTNGGALTCYSGEAAALPNGGGILITYPGATTLPAANCLSTLGPNGTITIDVPFSNVTEPGAIDSRLHEVTASTMTLTEPANTVPSTAGLGGVLFNLIDAAQGYVFDPLLPTSVVSRKTHGSAGNFDVNLPLTGTRGVECRTPGHLPNGASGDYQLIFTFAKNLVSVPGASVSSGTGSVSSRAVGPSPNQYTVNLSGVADQQYLTVTLSDVVDVTGASGDVVSPELAILIGDVNASGRTDNGDASVVRNLSGTIPSDNNTARADVNCSGRIDNGDATIIRNNSGNALPSSP